MASQKGMGFIDFSDMDNQTGSYRKGDKVYVPQGPACHMSHPELMIGGGRLLGGNCRDHDRHKGVDLYVALDYGMAHPKFDVGVKPSACVYYPIENMKIPKIPTKFSALIDYLLGVLAQGQTVHVGCIGGHGRTGLVIAAIVARLKIAPGNDAIEWTRQHYCHKAVETKEQENFLVVHFGAKMPPAGKTPYEVDKRHKGA